MELLKSVCDFYLFMILSSNTMNKQDQGRAASCFAMASVETVESLYHEQTGVAINVSRQDVFQNVIKSKKQSRVGGSMHEAYKWMTKHGCVPETRVCIRGSGKSVHMMNKDAR
jgi:hypothetical protein